jgi:hypothetical protein
MVHGARVVRFDTKRLQQEKLVASEPIHQSQHYCTRLVFLDFFDVAWLFFSVASSCAFCFQH